MTIDEFIDSENLSHIFHIVSTSIFCQSTCADFLGINMATWLPQKHRALALPWTLKIAALILFANSVFAVDNYSIVEEHQSCDHVKTILLIFFGDS